MTKRLYLEDAYLKEFSATVTVAEGAAVVLDNSAFYPQGGGQPSDTGTLASNNTYSVSQVRAKGDEVWHTLDQEGLAVGDTVAGAINWDFRYKIMRMHTAAHLLSALLYNDLGVLITGNQLGADKTRMDFNLEGFDREQIMGYQQKANHIIAQNLPVTTETMPRDEALKIPEISKLANVLPKNLPELRIVSIGEVDRQADGGTHVNNTREIGRVKFLKLENKGASNRRLYYAVEEA